MLETIATEEEVKCYHCGDLCSIEPVVYETKSFCCNGCKVIYELFQDSELQDFYLNRTIVETGKFDYLNNGDISKSFIQFRDENFYKVELSLPAIHCSSCLYILENLPKINAGVLKVTVNFSRKTAEILYNPKEITLSKVCDLLASIGYVPDLSKKEEKKKILDSNLAIKIGVAGFCFGNIMLISFPEYLGIDLNEDAAFTQFFGWISIALSLPILFYSGIDYIKSAIAGIQNKFINIDVPIALGMIVLFTRSFYEIYHGSGSGYLDSLAGLIFFLLIGRWFQSKTYEELSFDRDYKSYFPLSVIKISNGTESSTPINELQISDQILIRNMEIIPADSILLESSASIDYSFVTGESDPVKVNKEEVVYAGGRLIGSKIKLQVEKRSSQSYLTNLWNNQAFKKEKHSVSEELTNRISKHFTVVILTIAFFGGVYWYLVDPSEIWKVVTAVLIVACPCALALSAPFTNGNTIRILGRGGFYLKKSSVSEKLPEIDTIIFDKTGTITNQDSKKSIFVGEELNDELLSVIKSMTSNSTHPLSQILSNSIKQTESQLDYFNEISGKGIQSKIGSTNYKLGSGDWVGLQPKQNTINKTRVYFSVNENCLGYFEVTQTYRTGMSDLMYKLASRWKLMVVSGDNNGELEVLKNIFPEGTEYYFDQKPSEKLERIKELQVKGHKVLMLGDGLNDAGALKQSDVGLAVTDDISSFSPACDGIIEGQKLVRLTSYLDFSRDSKKIIYKSFGLSFLYNIGGISLALAGLMTPIAAAILMPLSSISVVLFTTLSGNYIARKRKV